MIKVTILTNNDRIEDIVRDDATIREVLADNDINLGNGKLLMDGFPVQAADINKPLSELCVNEGKCYLAITQKTENAATVSAVGDSLVFTSAMKLEDLKLIEKYRPEALTVYEEKDDKKVKVFKAMTGDEAGGELTAYGVVFSANASPEGYARVTMFHDLPTDKLEDAIVDEFGPALLRLNALEAQLTGKVDEIKEEHARIKETITVA